MLESDLVDHPEVVHQKFIFCRPQSLGIQDIFYPLSARDFHVIVKAAHLKASILKLVIFISLV